MICLSLADFSRDLQKYLPDDTIDEIIIRKNGEPYIKIIPPMADAALSVAPSDLPKEAADLCGILRGMHIPDKKALRTIFHEDHLRGTRERGMGSGDWGTGAGDWGKRGAAPGKQGAAPGKQGAAPGKMGVVPGKRGAAPGMMGVVPGKQGAAPGKQGVAPGKMQGAVIA